MQQSYSFHTYGRWDTAVFEATPTSITAVNNNQLIQEVGNMNIYGSVQVNGKQLGNIGSIDKQFEQMSHWKLKKGHYPNASNELLIESFVLDYLGMNYTLNQNLTLSVQCVDSKGTVHVIEKTFMICGILENYSANWIATNSLLNYIILPDDDFLPYKKTNLFINPKKNYDSIFSEINLDHNVFEKNNRVEIYYQPFSNQNKPYTILGISAILFLFLFLWFMLQSWIQLRSNEISILKACGADDRLLIVDCVKLFLKGELYSIILLLFLSGILQIQTIDTLFVLAASVFAILLLQCLMTYYLRKIPCIVNIYATNDTTIIHPKHVKERKITIFSLALRSIKCHKMITFLQIMSLTVLMLFMYQNITNRALIHTELEIKKSEPDIILQKDEGISEDTLHTISRLTSIANMDKYYENQQYTVSWKQLKDSPLFHSNIGKELFFSSNNSHDAMLSPFYGIAFDDDQLDRLDTYINQGKLNVGKLRSGKQIILYLPKIQLNKNDFSFGYSASLQNNLKYEEIIQETTIQVGDILYLTNDQQIGKDVEVGAIITSNIENDTLYSTSMYKIIGSDHILNEHQGFNRTDIYFNNIMELQSTEERISQLANQEEISFTNNSVVKRYAIANEESMQLFNVVMISIFIIVMIFTQAIFSRTRMKLKKQTSTIFYQLGIDSRIIFYTYFLELLFVGCCSILASFILYLPIKIGYFNSITLGKDFYIMEIFSNNIWSWRDFFILNAAMLFLFIIQHLFYFYKTLKD